MSTARNSAARLSATTSISRRAKTVVILILGCWALFVIQRTLYGQTRSATVQLERFPRKIWQSWKVDALRFEQRDTERAMSWTTKNPSFRYEVLTDENSITYVEHFFGLSGLNRPDIVATYKSLNARIIQADLLRYLIMYVEGGLWADIDVEALRPIEHFVPTRFNESDISMVIGVETDEPTFKDHPVLGSKARSFCQWTFICKPRLPVMLRLIDNILLWLNALAAQQGRPISELELDFDEVLTGTGPSAFTVAILQEMSAITDSEITWDNFHNLDESKVVGGILVLPSEAFAAGTGHSDSGNHGGRAALVKHHFHASSWPTNHPRYKHPIFGEVEKCNWDPECVKLWDTNAAFFGALPEADQLKMIAIKDLEEKVADPIAAEKHGDSNVETDLKPPAGLPPVTLPSEGVEVMLEEIQQLMNDDDLDLDLDLKQQPF